jgi:acyl phosphate:glycerol-3-phosphate acyltransferase
MSWRSGGSYTRPVMPGRGSDVAACTVGYAVGSMPFGLWLGKLVRGVDVREHGSGGMGTTNVLRTVGPAAAGAVFVLDVAKGAAAVAAARAVGASRAGQAGAGFAAVVGHSWPVFARFRGGKSVATAFGALLLLSPEGSAAAVIGGLSALAVSRTVSVGSLAAAASATVGSGVAVVRRRKTSAFAFTAAASAVIAVRHAANIRRLLRGEEPQVSLRRGR